MQAPVQTPAVIDSAVVYNNIANARLREIDSAISASGLPPMNQMGVLFVACALCFRRVVAEHADKMNRGKRMKLMKLAMEELGDKIRKYGMADNAPEF